MCYNPITIKTPDGYKKVKCGHCLECLKEYQNAWSNRMYEQLKSCKGKAVFFTLTYNEESVPKNYLVDGHIYRSYSDYNYDNTAIRFVGKRMPRPQVYSIVSGERIKTGVPAYKVLQDLGIPYDEIVDFNAYNNDKKFLENVKNLFSRYLSTVDTTIPGSCLDDVHSWTLEDVDEWFENYDGPLFSFDDVYSLATEVEDLIETPSPEQFQSAVSGDVLSFNSVRKEDVVKWLNRGLNKIKRNYHHGFKWFVTSEYGPRTQRPHYHGILFGVTRVEAQCMFNDWNRHFGFSKIDNVDMSKGGTSYCAKYCSKGMYEHPLCSKDFFYFKKDGTYTEYHSKHYERCLEWFGLDEPIVDPTFHLVSHGMGLDYVDNMKDFFLNDFTDINFQEGEATPTVVVTRDTEDNFIEYLDLTDWKSRMEYIEKYKITLQNKNNYEKSFLDSIDTLFKKFNYTKVDAKGKTWSYPMPQYYRAKMLTDGLRAALATYTQQMSDELYRRKLRAMDPDFETRENPEVISLLEKEAQEERETRIRRARKSFEKYLNKSKL